MPLDDVLDHFDWEKEADDDQKLEELLEKAFTPDVETVRIKRFDFSWKGELAKIILRKNHIPSFLTNSLTTNMLNLEWAQTDLYVRAQDAEQAVAILDKNLDEEEEN